MEKYLFNDGTNVIREVQSREALNALLAGVTDKEKASIWIYNTHEWMSYAAFMGAQPASEKNADRQKQTDPSPVLKPAPRHFRWLRNAALAFIAIAGILLVYNFTRVKWTSLEPLTVVPVRPDNSPFINIDSLVQTIEWSRGQKLDKVTRTNLGIRNNWPDQILLKAQVSRDSSTAGTRFHDLLITLDNATGYQLDEVVAEWSIWKDQRLVSSDTIRFEKINYTAPLQRTVVGEFRGDSLSVKVERIRARVFSFCYAADKKSNSGNLNDRWFCR